MLSIQNYVRVKSLDEAYDLNQNKHNRIIGGMLWLKTSSITVPTAIDLSDLGLDTIEETDEAFSIGAMVSLRALEQHAGLNEYTKGAVRQTLKDIVGVQFRNMATVGGSVYGRFGFSAVLTMLMAMDTYVELHKGGIIPLEQFADMPRDRDILVRIIIKKTSGGCAYQAVRGSRTDFPILTCAAGIVNGEYRVAIGARPMKAAILRDQKGLLSGGVTEESAQAFADYAAETLTTGTNIRGSAEYRTHLIRVLTRRVLMELEG